MALSLTDKRFLLIIGGGIAAYKTLDLIRRLQDRGATVRAILTQAGERFVTPLSIAALTGDNVYTDLFSLTDEVRMGHIELSRDADLLVVAPATADLMAKMASGLANDLATTTLLATDKQVLLAPAMNVRMWRHPATQRNLERLKNDGVLIVGPNDGEMACGEFGPGRMAEPLEIVAAIEVPLKARAASPLPSSSAIGKAQTKSLPLFGKRALVTAGPTHEPIDPIRFIANRSSGRQGYAIAQALAALGAQVTLISGPVALSAPTDVRLVRVETACEMLEAVEEALPAEITVFAAAVADWRVSRPSPQKIKKTRQSLYRKEPFKLVENPDILAIIARRKRLRPSIVIGFAAETEQVIENAQAKLKRKGCDLIIANDVSAKTGVMGGNRNQVYLISSQGVEKWEEMSKIDLAKALAERVAWMLASKSNPL